MVNRCDWQPFFAWRPVRLIDGEMRRGWVERRAVPSRDGVIGYGVVWAWQYRPSQHVSRLNWRPIILSLIILAAIATAFYGCSGEWLGPKWPQ